MINGFIKLPRSILNDNLWKDLSPHCQMVFIEILSRVCFRSQKYDDFGVLIELNPGQICASIREILKWCGKHFSKNDVERSIKKLILCQFLRQEVRHRKLILTISHLDTLNHIINLNETDNETNLRQTRDKLETQKKKDKKEKKEKEEQHIAQSATPLRKIDIFFSFENRKFENIKDEDMSLWKQLYPSISIDTEILSMINWCLDKPQEAKSKKSWRRFISNWLRKSNEHAINKAAYNSKKTVPIQRERLLDQFKNGSTYNGAECTISAEGICFDRGMNHGEVKFNAFGFDDQLRQLLNRFGISNPLNSNGNAAPIDQRT